MIVGRSSAMSPLHSRTLASVSVLIRPYPIGMPTKIHEISTMISRICASGRKAR